jgi:hypothetical protein
VVSADGAQAGRVVSADGAQAGRVVSADGAQAGRVASPAGVQAGQAAGPEGARPGWPESPRSVQADQRDALAALAAEFGPRTAELVGAVTNPEYAPDRDAHEQYREHVAESLRDHPWARVIKAYDFTDNGAGLIHTTGPRLRTLADKYAPLVPVLRDLIARPDTPLDTAAKEHILAQLDRAADRFAAVRGDQR